MGIQSQVNGNPLPAQGETLCLGAWLVRGTRSPKMKHDRKPPAYRKPNAYSHEVLCFTIPLNRISKTGSAYKIQLLWRSQKIL